MWTDKWRLLVASLIFVLGVIAGAVPSAGYSFRRGANSIVDNWANANARNAVEVAGALTLIRTAPPTEGLETLETHLDRLLVGLTPAYLEGFAVGQTTLAAIREARDSARSYRARFPRPASRRLLDREIADFLGTPNSATP